MLRNDLLWIFFLLLLYYLRAEAKTEIADEININFGEDLVITCSFNLSDYNIQDRDSDKLSIVWRKNTTSNIIEENNPKRKYIKYELKFPFINSNYTVDEAFEEDSDTYFCDLVLTNPVNKTKKLQHRIKLPVHVTDEFQTDHLFINTTNDVFNVINVKIYNSVIIVPVIDDIFITNISSRLQSVKFNWFKDFKTFTPYSSKNSLVLPNFSAISKINCTQYDAGLYSIIVTEATFRSNISHQINVLSKPILKILFFGPRNLSNLKLKWTAKCEIYAYPEGEVIWAFTPCHNFQIDSQTNCNYNRTKILGRFNQSSLKWDEKYDNKLIKYSIIDFTPPSSGILECRGKNVLKNNKVKENSISANILIENVPNSLNISSSKLLNEIYEGNQFNLTCKGLEFFYDLEWYSKANQIAVDSNNDLFSDIEIVKETNELHRTITLKFRYIKISNQTTYECRGYKNSNKTIYDSEIIKINVHKSYSHLYYLLIFIPIIVICISVLYYYYYRKNNKELPWMLVYDEKYEFPVDRIKIEKELGSGAFGVVFEAIAEDIVPNEPETTVAIKTIKKSTLNENTLKSLESELEILLSLGKHLNLVNLLGAVTKNPLRYKLMVIVEFCKFGNMKNYLFENRNCFVNQIDPATGLINKNINSQTYDNQYNPMEFTTTTLLLWAYQIARGMDYVSSQKILHGDLAARNILLSDDNVVKICDFGLAKSMNYQYNYQSKGNAPLPIRWLAIETLESGLFSTLSDIWSYGIVLWEFFSLCKDPYEKLSVERFSLLEKLQSGYRMEAPRFCNNEIHNIMLECWKEDPESRPAFIELEKKLKNFIDDNISEYYVKLNEPYEKENEENKNRKNAKDTDQLTLNNLDNKINNVDITKTCIRNIPFSKSNESANEYTNQQKNENPETNIAIKSVESAVDSIDKINLNEAVFKSALSGSNKEISSLESTKAKSFNNNKKNTPVEGYLMMTLPKNERNSFDFESAETRIEDVLINFESDEELPLEPARSYENIDFSAKNLPIVGSYENIDFTVKSPREPRKYCTSPKVQPKPRMLPTKPRPEPKGYVVMKPIPKERSLTSLTDL